MLVMRGAWGPSTSRLEQPHKQERHHTLTQNLKAMGLWVLLLIRRSTFTILSDVGHITHTCMQHSPSSESITLSCSPFKRKLLLARIAVAGFSANGPTRLYRHCCFLRKRTDCLGRTLRQTGALIPLLGHEGSLGSVHIDRLTLEGKCCCVQV